MTLNYITALASLPCRYILMKNISIKVSMMIFKYTISKDYAKELFAMLKMAVKFAAGFPGQMFRPKIGNQYFPPCIAPSFIVFYF